LGVPGAEQPDLVPAYAGPTPADPFGSGHVFDIFDVMEQAELNAVRPSRPPAGRRAPAARSRWQPPHWAVPSHPPMLVGETAASDRPDRGPAIEAWALPSRPFMLRRDRHSPRWSQNRRATSAEPVPPNGSVPAAEPAVPRTRPVPIEAGPPPTPEPAALPAMEAPAPEAVVHEIPAVEPAVPDMVLATPVPAAIVAEASVPAELPAAVPTEPSLAAAATESVPPERQPESPPVPANDVVSGPVVQPIVIGAESTPPLERKRGWWRRR
jgi:hypothetical protein